MPDPVTNPNHIADGLRRLLLQFQGQPSLEGIVKALLTQVQELEAVFMSLMLERRVLTAVGVQLDGIGDIVGEPRLGRTDTDYRTAILGKITRNKAHSRIEDLLSLFTLLLPTFTFVLREGPGPSAFTLRIVGGLQPTDPSPVVLSAQLHEAKGGGIRGGLLWSLFDDSDTFTFADAGVPQTDTLRGFGNGPPTTTGGRLAGVSYE